MWLVLSRVPVARRKTCTNWMRISSVVGVSVISRLTRTLDGIASGCADGRSSIVSVRVLWFNTAGLIARAAASESSSRAIELDGGGCRNGLGIVRPFMD